MRSKSLQVDSSLESENNELINHNQLGINSYERNKTLIFDNSREYQKQIENIKEAARLCAKNYQASFKLNY